MYRVHSERQSVSDVKQEKCFVEVYDRKPQYEGAVRLRCGYISEAVEAIDVLEQLCELLPLEQWKQLICCSPGDFKSFCLLVSSRDLGNAYPRAQAEFKLDSPGYHELMFHNDSKALGKQQLVIVRRPLV
jgi:hypothetical protein